MAAAANLRQAARDAWLNLSAKWQAGSIAVDLGNFLSDVAALFPGESGDDTQKHRTVTNWMVPLRVAQQNYTAYSGSIEYVAEIIEGVAKMCWVAYMGTGVQPPLGPIPPAAAVRISAGEAAAILAAYNARF